MKKSQIFDQERFNLIPMIKRIKIFLQFNRNSQEILLRNGGINYRFARFSAIKFCGRMNTTGSELQIQ